MTAVLSFAARMRLARTCSCGVSLLVVGLIVSLSIGCGTKDIVVGNYAPRDAGAGHNHHDAALTGDAGPAADGGTRDAGDDDMNDDHKMHAAATLDAGTRGGGDHLPHDGGSSLPRDGGGAKPVRDAGDDLRRDGGDSAP